MCGITGFIDFSFQFEKEHLRRMMQSLAHRGPDDQGIEFIQRNEYSIGLGHTRLSIIDTGTQGHQPMYSHDHRFLIVFNGEIYNYKALKANLILKGHHFHTESDTEVLMELYRANGDDMMQCIRGMFAFVIWDSQLHNIFIGRDRFGVKPFYYSYQNNVFVFGSELKSLVATSNTKFPLNKAAITDYFKFGYISEPNSIYEGICKMPKGHCAKLDLIQRTFNTTSYWKISDFFKKEKTALNENDLILKTKNLVIESLRYRMVSDVPVGIFLSGGYDSTLIASLIAHELGIRPEAFTLGFSGSIYDESQIAAATARQLGLKHHLFDCKEHDVLDMVNLLPVVYDEPLGDPSALPTLLLSKFTTSHVKVVLSGDGGDEAFAGYRRYMSQLDWLNRIKNPLFRTAFLAKSIFNPGQDYTSTWKSLQKWKHHDLSGYLNKSSTHWNEKELSRFLTKFFHHTRTIDHRDICVEDQLLMWDLNHYLPDNVLVKVDRATMHFGLEAREPLLDHDLQSFAAQLPFESKIQNKMQKFPLRSIVHQYIDPTQINRPKKGFEPPLKEWMNGILKPMYNDLTSEKFIKEQGIFDHKYIGKIGQIKKPEYLKYRKKWSIFVFQQWYRHWYGK